MTAGVVAAVVAVAAAAMVALAAASAFVAGLRRHRRLLLRAAQASAAVAALLVPALLLMSRPAAGWRPPSLQPPSPSLEQLAAAAAAGANNDSSSNSSSAWPDHRNTGGYWAKVLRHFPNGGPDSPQYRLLESRCLLGNATAARRTAAAAQHPIGFSDPAYLINPGGCQGRVSILMAVHSAVRHADRRRVIRQTWGSSRYVRGRRLLLVFFLGRTADAQLQASVAEEAEHHGDIVQRDFLDSYRNMTLKHLGLYDWLMEFCQSAEWLVKTDDDVFVDAFHLEAFLGAYQPDGICCKLQDGRPERAPGSKWLVSRAEFGPDRYPKYCEGYAYIMRPTVAQLLYWCSVFSVPMWIDDVYVLGILVQRLGLRPQEPLGGHLWADLLPSHAGRAIADNLFLVDRHNNPQASTWIRLHRAAMLYSY